MYIVTGAAGFIGSNIIKALNEAGKESIIAVDQLPKQKSIPNLSDCKISDLVLVNDLSKYLASLEKNNKKIHAIFHKGACSDTTETDREYMINNNYQYSINLLEYCLQRKIPFIYASSAAVYGDNDTFIEDPRFEKPLNLYAESKLLFDNYVRNRIDTAKSQIVGLRYFNVYGPREQHKEYMASVAYRFRNQILETGKAKLFKSCNKYADGEQRRDFIYVGDVVKVNLWFLNHPEVSGIFNLGTGHSQTFNDIADAVIEYYGKGEIEYIPFDEKLKGRYQSYTQADISNLRKAGFNESFLSVKQGINEYMQWLDVRD
jgi:ADP-L-glycero-D-manno-heptose 6-epimerase